jgi:ABC-type branched-subunit amino acid transport system ATPase component/predicted MFS family arabinose efflux permease
MTGSAPETGDVIVELEHTRDDMRDSGRAALGVTGQAAVPSLRSVLREGKFSLYPLSALMLLYVVDQFQVSALTTLTPEISDGLGIPIAAIAGLFALQALCAAVVALPVAALVQRVPRRAAVSIVTAFGWALATGMTGFAGGAMALAFLVMADGASSASVRTVHPPLLYDLYPPAARVRVFSLHTSAVYGSLILGPAFVAVLSYTGLTWRGIFLVMGGVCLLVAVLALRLRDPGFGAQDIQLLRETVRHQLGTDAEPADPVDTDLRFFETVRRALMIPTVRRLLLSFTFLGMFLTPLGLFLTVYLNDHFFLDATGRGVFNAVTPAASIVALVAIGKLGDRWYRGDPGRLVRLSGVAMAAGVLLLVAAVLMPNVVLFGALIALALSAFAVLGPVMTVAMQGVIPARARAHVVALQGIATYGVGSLVGVLFLGGLANRFGIGVALCGLALPGLIAGAILSSAGRLIGDDITRLVDAVVEEEEQQALVRSGTKVPLLAVRGIDFAYDQLQVLFDVSFTLQHGEMVALLGTNGAGKSTLLRVISGLGLPSTGSVRLDGADVTFLDPQRRVALGIMQIAGGKGTFPKLTVLENLKAFAYPLGRDKVSIQRGIDATFEAFPRLAERRHQVAGTMSGGENQMLALACAFMVRPKILLIDELSLGLAPKIVGELLGLVRRINAEGTAVVLVEQSVNIALGLVDHAYFMEKGEIRFDGPAAELVERGDLLRSVFLQGATKGLVG